MTKLIKVGDLHIGRFGNSSEFLDDSAKFFREFLFPIITKQVKENGKNNVVVVFMGDIYDSKQYIDQITNSLVIDLFVELANMVNKIIILVGNHDTKLKHDLTHSSSKSLSLLPQVQLITKETIVDIDGIKFGMIPYIADKSTLREILKDVREKGVTRIMGHNSVAGFFYEGIPVPNDHNISIEELSEFDHVEMGHIHKEQRKKNVHFLGTPYHIRSIEHQNEKNGVWIESAGDVENQEFIENKMSPRHKRINLMELLNMSVSEANKYVENSFVMVAYPHIFSNVVEFTKLSSILTGYRKIDYKDYVAEKDVISSAIAETGGTLDIKILFQEYMDKDPTLKFGGQSVVLSDTDKTKLYHLFIESMNNLIKTP